MANRRCMVHYRKLRREEDQFPAITLSDALAQAMDHNHEDGTRIGNSWLHRVVEVPNNEDQHRFLNDFHNDDEGFFGNTCLFSRGQLQALIESDPNAKIVDIAEKRAPDGTEYLHGIAYWLAFRDHFLMVQHVSIQAKAMEEYLTWLLRDQTSTIGGNHYVQLQSVFDRDLLGRDLGDIRSIEVGGVVPETGAAVLPVALPVALPAPELGKLVEYETHETLAERVLRGYLGARGVLEAAIGSMETQRLIDSVPDEATLEVNVTIGYRAKKRKFSREFMSNLEAGLRNLPVGEVRVRSNKGTIVGEDARLHAVIPIKLVRDNSSLLDNKDALAKLRKVYLRFLEDGMITD